MASKASVGIGVGALLLEVLSGVGDASAWCSVVDPEHFLKRNGRGAGTGTRAGPSLDRIIVPGGSLATRGVGDWILRHLGAPAQATAERQFNLAFRNTAVDDLALMVFAVVLELTSSPASASCCRRAAGRGGGDRSRSRHANRAPSDNLCPAATPAAVELAWGLTP